MRPTKEMILETKQLVSDTDQHIKEIIRQNDIELNTIRKKNKKETPIRVVNPKLIYGALLGLLLLLTYQLYRFFISA